MIGLILLSAVTLLLTSYLAFLAYASRQTDNNVVWALLPPYGFYFLAKNKQLYRLFNWFFFPLLFVCIVIAVLNFIVVKGTDASAKDIPQIFDAVKLDARAVRLVQGSQLLPDTEIKIFHSNFNVPAFVDAIDDKGMLNFTQARVDIVTKDTATKQLSTVSETLDITFDDKSGDLMVALHHDVIAPKRIKIPNWRLSIGSTSTMISQRDVERAIASMWATAPDGFSYDLGGMKRLSEKQTSALITFYHQGKRVSQHTITVDLKSQGIQLNYRSMLLMRQVFNDFRNKVRTDQSKSTQLLAASGIQPIERFFEQWQRFKGQPIELIKKPNVRVSGTLEVVDKGKRISLLQNRGAGTVMAKIPRDLIESLSVNGVVYKYIAPDVIYVDELTGEEIPPEQLSSTVAVTPNPPKAPVTVRSELPMVTSDSDVESINSDAFQTSQPKELKPDPYMALAGKKLEVITVSGAKRTGQLIQVIPHKTIEIGSKHGGLKISIPQKDIQQYNVIQ